MSILLGIIATARLTEIFVYEDIMLSIREFFGIAKNSYGETSLIDTNNKVKNFIGRMLSCFSCASIWGSIFVLSLYYIYEPVFYVFSLLMIFSYVAVKLDVVEDWFKSMVYKNNQ